MPEETNKPTTPIEPPGGAPVEPDTVIDPALEKHVDEVMHLDSMPDTPASDLQVQVVLPEEHHTSSRHLPSKRSLLLISVIVLVLALAGVGALLFMRKTPEKKQTTTPANSIPKAEEPKRFKVDAGLIEGTVEYSTDSGKSWQKLAVDTTMNEGTMVRTSTDGRAVLLIDDGSAVRLAASSTITLTSLTTTNVVITSTSGELYSRVTTSSTRKFSVISGDQTYVAKGTAFRIFSGETKKGVEVFHSSVSVEKKSTDVAAGKAFFVKNDQKDKENTLVDLDLTALKKDDFIKWNGEQDKKKTEYANDLGVLTELDKPDPTPTPAPAPAPPPPPSVPNGITLSGSVSEYSAIFTWSVVGIDTSKGFKLVKSSETQAPTYPDNSVAYVEAGKTSYTVYLGDGKTYYFRICAYREGSCESYSNAVTITTPEKPKPTVTNGTITLSLSGTTASWTDTGTAPYGYKLVLGTTSNPTYESSELKTKSSETTASLPDGMVSGTKYYMRVCRLTDTTCTDYSNQKTYTKP